MPQETNMVTDAKVGLEKFRVALQILYRTKLGTFEKNLIILIDF